MADRVLYQNLDKVKRILLIQKTFPAKLGERQSEGTRVEGVGHNEKREKKGGMGRRQTQQRECGRSNRESDWKR